MDNFTHSLVGWALGQTGLKRATRKGLAALILGANMPDVDIVFGWVNWTPLATHRGFTHGILAALIMPPMLAGLLWLLDRWQQARGETFKSGLPMRVGWLVALSYIGAITHPLLDLQTTYSVQLLSPFDARWFHTETLFIIDVWIWTGLALAIWLSRRRERRNGRWRRPAVIGLAVMCAYMGLNGAISLRPYLALKSGLTEKASPIYMSQEPVLFWRRTLVWRHDGRIGRASYDPLRTHPLWKIDRHVPDNMDDPLVRRAMTATPAIVRFMRWSTMPMAAIQRSRCSATILFSDARFGEPRPGDLFLEQVTLPVAGKDCPAS